jgi:hypothetical protein
MEVPGNVGCDRRIGARSLIGNFARLMTAAPGSWELWLLQRNASGVKIALFPPLANLYRSRGTPFVIPSHHLVRLRTRWCAEGPAVHLPVRPSSFFPQPPKWCRWRPPIIVGKGKTRNPVRPVGAALDSFPSSFLSQPPKLGRVPFSAASHQLASPNQWDPSADKIVLLTSPRIAVD